MNRPIIFIGHSLGGSVIRSALVRALNRYQTYESILQCTTEIFLFACPGVDFLEDTSIGDLQHTLQKLSVDAGFRDTQSKQRLRDWAVPLTELERDFSEGPYSGSLLDIHVTKILGGDAGVVIPDLDENVLKIEGDHTTVVNLTGREQGYAKFRERIQQQMIAAAMGQMSLEPTETSLLLSHVY